MVAVYQHSCAHRVSKQLRRRSQMAQAIAFDVWMQYTQHCHDLRVRMQQMVTEAAFAKLHRAFAGWAHWAAASAGILRYPSSPTGKAHCQLCGMLPFIEDLAAL